MFNHVFSQKSAAIFWDSPGEVTARVGMIWANSPPQGLQKKEDELRQRSEDQVFRAFHI